MHPEATRRNQAIVHHAFEAWSEGEDGFFAILAPEVTWTIAGSGKSARTYIGKKRYVDEVMTPLKARIKENIKPHVRHIWADADYVIVRWFQESIAIDNGIYRNDYVWILRLHDDLVVAVEAFLDLSAYDAFLERIPLQEPSRNDKRY